MPRTIAMMQPYLFPYLGYFQLIAQSDAFVLGDDLQYTKRSWINRNRVLVNGEAKLITFPLKKAGNTECIGERWLSDDFDKEANRLLRMLELTYSRAPCFSEAMPLISDILLQPERNLAVFTEYSIRALCAHLDIDVPIYRGSELFDSSHMDKQERVVRLAKHLGGERYVNPIGGMELYCNSYFRDNGLELRFLRMDEITYPQFKNAFVPALSIIDVLMFNSKNQVIELLDRYELLEGADLAPAPHPLPELARAG